MDDETTIRPPLKDLPPTAGVYSLLILVSEPTITQVRSGRQFNLPKGIYVYTGSARGKGSVNLANRIRRHFKPSPQKISFWHIDYLLDQIGPPQLCVFARTTYNRECHIIHRLQRQNGNPITGFGSSDCNADCGGHLIHFPEQLTQIKTKLLHSYKSLQLAPQIIHP